MSAAATWAVVDATSLLDDISASTVLTTAYVESAAFTPGAITIDGIAVKVFSRAASPSGTISVRLAQGAALVAGTEVTINVSDLPAADQGWFFFKFAAPVTLLAATLYTVSAKTSIATQVNLTRNVTAANWCRMLRTTTTGAPVATDDLFICGEWTAAGVKTNRTVTMDSTVATDYGSSSTTNSSLGISKGGTLTWASAAATNYILRLSGILTIYAEGLMNMGTVATPCPRDSSMQLEFDSLVDGDFGMQIYGQLIAQGQSRSSGKNIVQCLLNTDEAALQTILGVDTDTGWLNGDEIAIASTTQTSNQCESRILSGAAAAGAITVTSGVTFAHSGTAPTQAEVILLTRNVRIRAVTSTLMGYVQSGTLCVVDLDWVSFQYLGTTVAKPTLQIACGASGSWNMHFCCARDAEALGGIVTFGAAWGNVTIEDFVSWKVGHAQTGSNTIDLIATTLGNWTLRRCTLLNDFLFIGNSIRVANFNGNMSAIRIAGGAGSGISIAGAATDYLATGKTWDNIIIHSMGDLAIITTGGGVGYVLMTNTVFWRNLDGGILIAGNTELAFHTFDWFGNGVGQIQFATANGTRVVTFRNGSFAGDSTFPTPRGMVYPTTSDSPYGPVKFENVTFGVASGIRVAHSVADLDFGAGATDSHLSEVILNHVFLTTGIANQSKLAFRSAIRYQRVNQVTGVHKTVYPAIGTVSLDTALFRTASPSMKLEPTNANMKLESGPMRVPVALGAAVSISVYVQKNVAYVGSAPRLMLRANPALNIDTDTVIATFSAAAAVWQALAGATPNAEEAGVFEFYVDCDGLVGQVNVDDWSRS